MTSESGAPEGSSGSAGQVEIVANNIEIQGDLSSDAAAGVNAGKRWKYYSRCLIRQH